MAHFNSRRSVLLPTPALLTTGDWLCAQYFCQKSAINGKIV
jgi:hypothetical protein